MTKLDRLGRSLEHLIELSKQLQAKGVDLVVLNQGIDTSHRGGPDVLPDPRRDRGVRARPDVRTHDGRPRGRACTGPNRWAEAKAGTAPGPPGREMYDERGEDGKRRYTVAQIAAEFGVGRPTIYGLVRWAQLDD